MKRSNKEKWDSTLKYMEEDKRRDEMRKDRIKERQEEAIKRQEKHDALSNKDIIKLAKSRRGNSAKEIERLEKK